MKKQYYYWRFLWECFHQVEAQKFAYLDSDYVLQHMPEYAGAQDELNRLSNKWEKRNYPKNMTTSVKWKNHLPRKKFYCQKKCSRKEKRQLLKKDKKAMDLQRRRFGVGGDLFTKREELVKPVKI